MPPTETPTTRTPTADTAPAAGHDAQPPAGAPHFDYARPGAPQPAGAGGDGSPTPWAAPADPAPSRGRRRYATVALFTAATLAAGATGSALTMLRDDEAVAPVTVTRTAAVPATSSDSAVGTAQAAAAAISPSVVTIAVSGAGRGLGPGREEGAISGTGSGVVLRRDGYIVTNNHVVSAAANGGSVRVTFSDGASRPATVVGTDPTSDLAVVKVDGAALTAATFADSDTLAVGQSVLAVGAPLGLSNTVTQGIVSTLQRPVRTGQSSDQQSVIDAVQTDAAINPGNSGGALVNLAGHVVGVPSAIATAGSGSGNIGVGFAIPSNDAVEVAGELIADGTASHAQLGVSVGDAPGAAGAGVEQVTEGGPAASAGLAAGDVITKVGDRPVIDADSLIVAVRDYDPGQRVEITYSRGGQTRTASVTLAQA